MALKWSVSVYEQVADVGLVDMDEYEFEAKLVGAVVGSACRHMDRSAPSGVESPDSLGSASRSACERSCPVAADSWATAQRHMLSAPGDHQGPHRHSLQEGAPRSGTGRGQWRSRYHAAGCLNRLACADVLVRAA